MSASIPVVPGIPILGNALQIDAAVPTASFERFAETWGEIFELSLVGNRTLFVSSQALANELCDEKRFEKSLPRPLQQVRLVGKDGLFTAYSGSHDWGIAHRLLMPAFGPMALGDMFDDMHDIATQLILKWSRFGSEHKIDVTGDFTRLTLDTIALCSMGVRFNSFYSNDEHPYVSAMMDVLTEAGLRTRRPDILNSALYSRNQKFFQDGKYLEDFARDIIQNRRQHPQDRKDLLNTMLHNVDSKTGEAMSDQNIVNNLTTFLVAGHETTSGMLSFLFYELMRSPEAYRRAQEEVDSVLGEEPMTKAHLSKLPWITACLRETLRLHPTAPGFAVEPKQDEIIGGGRFMVPKGRPLIIVLPSLHKDPRVYGEDAWAFKPERMLDEPFNALPPNSWKPFGNGSRACIGRSFAWQEAIMVVAMLLQNLDFRQHDPSYQLKIKSSLTIKPDGFHMTAKSRREKAILQTSGKEQVSAMSVRPKSPQRQNAKFQKQISIFYGSNTGTCEALATNLSTAAAERGLTASVDILDSATKSLPTDQPVILISSSYEGEPPDNAGHFTSWLANSKDISLSGVHYAVFGCGNREWAKTYQKIPTMIDNLLQAQGATRLADRGEADAIEGSMFDTFDRWLDGNLWPGIEKAFGADSVAISNQSGPESNTTVSFNELDIEVSTSPRSNLLRHDVYEALVTANNCISSGGRSRKMHTELQLPTGVSYSAGDYLSVLPCNPQATVRRVMRRFNMPWDTHITIKAPSSSSTTAPAVAVPRTTLPTNQELMLSEVLSTYVELTQPATLKQATQVAETILDEKQRAALKARLNRDFISDFQARNVSLLDILEANPTATYPLAAFLAAVPPLRVRQYSISSSPLASSVATSTATAATATNAADPATAYDGAESLRCTLTYSVLDAPDYADPSRRRLGVASNYLAALEPGDLVHVAVRASKAGFRPPRDRRTPMIMIAAGTGIAPFRGFIQERAAKLTAAKPKTSRDTSVNGEVKEKVNGTTTGNEDDGKAILFYGCRSPTTDDLHREEMDEWEGQGAVEIKRAFSGAVDGEHNNTVVNGSKGGKHVQDLLWEERELVRTLLFREGANVYLCGSAAMGSAVSRVLERIYIEEKSSSGEGKGEVSEEEARAWVSGIRGERFWADIFS